MGFHLRTIEARATCSSARSVCTMTTCSWNMRVKWESRRNSCSCRLSASSSPENARCPLSNAVSYTHLTLPTKRIV